MPSSIVDDWLQCRALTAVFALIICPAGCAIQQHPLTAAAAASLRGRSIAMTARPRSPFFVTAPGTPFIPGSLAIVAQKSEAGTRVVRENGIPDPALDMLQELTDDLRHRYSLKLGQQAIYVSDDDPKQITARHPAADLILDVGINSLSLEPFSPRSAKYHVRYAAYVRLIDAKFVHAIDGRKGRVIADGRCIRSLEETPNAPTYEDFLAHGAQRLKYELDVATKSCAEEFRTKVLTPDPAR